jgi:hypothetical protein
MAKNPYSVTVTVEAPARGSVQQSLVKFAAAQCVCTWSWGLQPATALIDWVSIQQQPAVVPMAQMTIQVVDTATGNALQTFYGICKSVTPTTGSDGSSVYQEFVDSREVLQWDVMYCAFNKRESRLVQMADGSWQWLRRYWHILPQDFNTMSKTYTFAPLTGAQILDYLFSSPTCESPWVRSYVSALNFPVYDVDCLSGRKLGTVITEISEQLGCTFTLMGGRYRLVWCMKGVGDAPTFPANSDNRRNGQSLSGNPTRIRILGDRDVYQVLNVPMQPDWLSAWQQFYDLDYLAADLFNHESTEAPIAGVDAGTPYNAIPNDQDGLIGRFLADARARTITVGQYATLRDARSNDGDSFRDYRKYGGRSRLQMPAALYIQTLLFRAYRPPDTFMMRNRYGLWMNLWSLELIERSVVEVTHDPVSGEMSYEVGGNGVPTPPISAGNGYAIAQGYQVGQDGYKTLRPQHIQLSQWVSDQDTWQHLSFQVDDSGEGVKFIIFDAPVLRTGDMITQCDIDGVTQDHPVLNAAPTLKPAPVRAALTFLAEPFSYVVGENATGGETISEGTRDDVQNVTGLYGEFVVDVDGGGVVELPYADGYTASEKALAIAESLLNQQFTYALGGYVVQGINGTQLTPTIDRVTVRWNESGSTEEVDFTTERDRNVTAIGRNTYAMVVPPERDFDRREQLLDLLPGQRELREQARQYQLMAASLQQSPRLARTLAEAFAMAFGFDSMPGAVFIDPDQLQTSAPGEPAQTLDAGTPIFRESDEDVAYSPFGESGDVTPTNPVFLGVTVFHNEQPNGPVRVTATGQDGVICARVQGPVDVNDSVGMGDGVLDYLEGSPTLTVGSALEAIDDDSTQLISVRTGGGGGGSPVWLA